MMRGSCECGVPAVTDRDGKYVCGQCALTHDRAEWDAAEKCLVTWSSGRTEVVLLNVMRRYEALYPQEGMRYEAI